MHLLLLLLTALPTGWVSRAQWHAQDTPMPEALRHTPRTLAIHHSGVRWKSGDDPVAKVQELQRWSCATKNWPDLPYHYMITPDGAIYEGRDPHFMPDSNTSYDLRGVLTIELWGNFEEQRVGLTQLTALTQLVRYLQEEQHTRGWQTHRQLAPGQTVCPGRDLARYVENGPLQTWVNNNQPELLPALPEGPQTFISP